MISRRTAKLIATVMAETFTGRAPIGQGFGTNVNALYDFLYEKEFPAWFCNAARKASSPYDTRQLQEFVMRLHTGEAVVEVTKDWSWPQREKLGQELLEELAADVLSHWEGRNPLHLSLKQAVEAVARSLELDGYLRRDGRLVRPEADVLEAKEEAGVLEDLYGRLGLAEKETAVHHLKLSEEHYLAQRWDDSISNSRKFLELTLQQVALAYASQANRPLDTAGASRPVRVRDYLETVGLLETREKETVASIYGLLSHTGGHPHIAQNEQARLLRHLALTVAQFVLLRYRAKVSPAA